MMTSVATVAVNPDVEFAAAILNILEDASDEREQLRDTYRAVMNILDDSSSERDALGATQSAMLNILDDFGFERIKAESALRDLAREMGERKQIECDLEAAVVTTDATNRALEQSNQQLESFSYSVAHDLRGPLRAINGFSQILLDDHAESLDPEGRRVLGIVIRNVASMGALIDGLLAFSRLGRAALAPALVDMAESARVAIRDLDERGMLGSAEVIVGPLEPAMVDPALIAQVWANLLSNAVKFGQANPTPRIVVSCDRHADEVVYTVADNGAGFDMAYSEKLFGVFQRLHTSAEFEGSGIGLAIVARIVERHGGHVAAVGKLNEGATFSFSIPIVEEPT